MMDIDERIDRFLAHRWAGLAAVIGMLLPFVLWRCAVARTFWGDEMYTVVLASLPVGELIGMCRADAHPPLYYLAIKAWLGATGLVFEPSIFLARLPNVFLWMGTCAVGWFGGRRLSNNVGGFLFALMLGIGAHGAFTSGDLRQYAALVLMMTGCWLLLLESWRRALAEGDSRAGTGYGVWGAYGVSAAVALWTQLLSGVFLFLLGLMWIGMSAVLFVRHRSIALRFILGGAAANGFALLAFAPWLATTLSNLEYMRSTGGAWMTPPTFGNLASVFLFWYPFGRSGFPAWPGDSLKLALGAATFLAPLLAWYVGTRIPPREVLVRDRVQRTMAASGVLLAAVFTLILWWVARVDLMKSFHGPRYPSIAVGVWIGGLCAMCAIAYERLSNRAWVLLAMAPLLATSLYGWGFLLLRQEWGEPWRLAKRDAELLPPPGTPLYVAPEALIPYWRATYADWPLHPLSELNEVGARTEDVTVLDLFTTKDIRREGILFWGAKGGALSESVERTDYPEYKRLVTVLSLRGFRHDVALRIGRMPPEEAVRPELDTAVSIAVPELQRIGDGWHLPKQTNDGQVYSWSSRDRVKLRFNRPIGPGRYIVRLRGGNTELPEDPAVFLFRFEDLPEMKAKVPAGPMTQDLFLILERDVEEPVLTIERQTWKDESGSTRGFLFTEAAIVPN